MPNRPPEIQEQFTRQYGLMAISTVTLVELNYGSENSQDPDGNRTVIEGFVARLELLPYDAEAAFQTELLRKELRSQGRPIGAYYCRISGHGRSRIVGSVARHGKSRNTMEMLCVPRKKGQSVCFGNDSDEPTHHTYGRSRREVCGCRFRVHRRNGDLRVEDRQVLDECHEPTLLYRSVCRQERSGTQLTHGIHGRYSRESPSLPTA